MQMGPFISAWQPQLADGTARHAARYAKVPCTGTVFGKALEMIKSMFATAIAAILISAPVQAEDKIGDIVGGIARQYLEQEQDRAAFTQAQGQNSLSGYQSYLRQFPNGAYAAQARDQVQRLGGVSAAPQNQAAESTSSLTVQERARVQRRLTQLGYNTSGTDGTFGPGTRRAIALWQRDRNYKQTGNLTTDQNNELLQGTTGSGTQTKSESTIDSGPSQTEAALGLSRQQRSAVQAGLTRRGFDTRGIDGMFGQGTRNAIGAWQRANDLTSTGYLTAGQAEKLTGQ